MKRLLLIGAIALASCSGSRPVADQVTQEVAEHRALVAAMEQHPSLTGQGNASEGKPLTFSRTVRPRPKGVEPARHQPPASPHKH